MILQRHAGLVAFLSLVLLYGCSSPSSAPIPATAAELRPAADVPAARLDASRPTLDPRVLPQPRAPLAGTPDLSNAHFTITDAILRELTAAGVPAAEADKLKSLRGRDYGNVNEFRAVVSDRLGKPGADAHLGTVLRHALVVDLADAPSVPEGKAELQAAETLKRPGAEKPGTAGTAKPGAAGAAVVLIPGMMGSDKFKPVFFDTNKTALSRDFQEAIDFNAKVLKADKALKVVIEGHCDARGSTEYNQALGLRRAESVRTALAAAGVPEDQLKAVSFGEERPAAKGDSEAAYLKNRRVVFNLQ